MKSDRALVDFHLAELDRARRDVVSATDAAEVKFHLSPVELECS